MAAGRRRRNSGEYEETALNDRGNDPDEDEFGYVQPTENRMSTALISQLPSRHLDELFEEDSRERVDKISTVRRKDTLYRALQLKNATLNSHHMSIGAEKIYQVLNSDPEADDEAKIKTLREMHQSLTIKRQVKEKLDAERRKKIASQSLGAWIRFKLALFMALDKFQYEVKSISYLLEPWHSSIKTIQGKFGSGVASYFIFLRWLLYINIWNFFVTFCFVVIPQLIYESLDHANHTTVSSETFSASDLLTGSGWFSDSLFYFGHYNYQVFEAIPNVPYNMPLAYLLSIGVNCFINLIAVSSSITASYQKNYVDTAGEIKHVFCNKIFSAWDYAIETDNAALLQKQAFCNEIKEILFMKREGQNNKTTRQRIIQRILLVLVSLFCMAAIGAIGFLIYYFLERNALKVNIRILSDMTLSLTVTLIASVSYFLLKHSSKLELFLSKRIKVYLIMIRVAALRIVMFGIIMYFWMAVYKPPRDQKVCYETELGKEIYRLILVNFLVTVLVFTLIFEFLRKLISRWFPSIGISQFDVAFNTLDLIYYQTLAWVAVFCVPLGSLMIIVILILLFYLKKSSMSLNCRPPKRSWSLNEAHTFYLILTFIMFFFAAVSVAYFIFGQEASYCGPFRDYENPASIIKDIFKGKATLLSKMVKYITSPSILFAIFCALGLVVYYMRAQAKAHISVIKKIREQLILASKDKVFLLQLFDEAFKTQVKIKTSSNNNKAPKLPPPKKPKGPDDIEDDVFSGRYPENAGHPIVSPKHTQHSNPHRSTNVMVNFETHENSPSHSKNANNSPYRTDVFRSPITSVGRDSPRLTHRGSPYPPHEHGFRQLVPGDNQFQI